MALCYVAIGSNQGDRQDTILQAVSLMKKSHWLTLLRCSHLYETEPVGMDANTQFFLNGVLELQTHLAPRQLLQFLLDIEHVFGRVRSPEKVLSRTLDLDLLLYDDWIVNEPCLVIPHPRMHEREFVLKPLNDLCPEQVIPGLNQTVREAWEHLQEKSKE
ncbi:MAG: 2-amino-4-hydroxy-6-hydroxymethyldihydropteridine diphosphokinase [bacterium]|jgi:2-amino-4-hydroxy-6-hydroxymethyldihydropteridine diphosphokinase